MPAHRFNLAAEAHYRDGLRVRHLAEGLKTLAADLATPEFRRAAMHPEFRQALDFTRASQDPSRSARDLGRAAPSDQPDPQTVLHVIHLTIIFLAFEDRLNAPRPGQEENNRHDVTATSVH